VFVMVLPFFGFAWRTATLAMSSALSLASLPSVWLFCWGWSSYPPFLATFFSLRLSCFDFRFVPWLTPETTFPAEKGD
jgi:hypothetical protein